MEYGENFLILSNNASKHKQLFQNLMQQIDGDNSILFYVSHNENKLNFSFKVQNFFFNVLSENTLHDLKNKLDKRFNKMEKDNSKILLISDWSKVDLVNCEIFLPFLENLIKKSQGLSPPGWKRRYRRTSQKTPFIIVNAFEMNQLNSELLQKLIQLHKRIYIFQENINAFYLPTISPSLETIFPKFHTLPQEILEKLAKDNLELVTLLLLEKDDKSGYQVLKEIASHFHCILSQGTLYPLLYQLEKDNKITKHNGKGREIIYSLNQKTKNQLKSQKETCLKAYQHLASFFE